MVLELFLYYCRLLQSLLFSLSSLGKWFNSHSIFRWRQGFNYIRLSVCKILTWIALPCSCSSNWRASTRQQHRIGRIVGRLSGIICISGIFTHSGHLGGPGSVFTICSYRKEQLYHDSWKYWSCGRNVRSPSSYPTWAHGRISNLKWVGQLD